MRHPVSGAPPLYQEIEHTADCGIVVEAAAPAALFEKAALALGAIMIEPASIEARQEREATVEASGWEELLHHWLTEVLAVFAVDGFIWAEVRVSAIGPNRVRSTLVGERFDPMRHGHCSEVKAVTYHDLSVSRIRTGWRARVIFDV